MKPIIEGKTKKLFPQTALVQAKDTVTWGNEHRATMPGKAVWATTTTVNVFELFRRRGFQVAFERQTGPDTFLAPYCDMIPLEVVGRSVIDPTSSFLKRNPGFPKEQIGVPLDLPIVEFFLKTSGKVFGGIALPDDDPLVIGPEEGGFGENHFVVCHPGKPGHEGATEIPFSAFGDEGDVPWLFEGLEEQMVNLTITLRDAFSYLGWTLGDWKGEFGWKSIRETPFSSKRLLMLADVVDNDSWRLRDPHGVEHSKQVVRDAWEEVRDRIAGLSAEETQAMRERIAAECGPHFRLVAEISKLLPDSRPYA